MPHRCSPAFALLLLCSGAARLLSQAAQPEMTTADSPATFKSKVSLVLVPVVVRDAQGHAVGNLTKDDFRLLDKGKPQIISRFSVERPNVPSPVAMSGNDAATADPVAGPGTSAANVPSRFTAYVFDDMNTAVSDLMRVQQAAIKHIAASLQPADRAAIYTTSGRGNLEFTDDANKLRDAILRIHVQSLYAPNPNDCPDLSYYTADLIANKNDQQTFNTVVQDTLVCANLNPSAITSAQQMVQGAARQMVDVGEQSTRVTLLALNTIMRRMAGEPGRRQVILVSSGFLTLTSESLESVTDILNNAARSNVIISALDARGLYTDSEFDASQRGSSTTQMQILKSQNSRAADMQQADVMAELADGTGGTFFQNNNDLGAGLSRLGAPPEYVYMLGFSPDKIKPDGTYHRLKITLLNGKGLALQARRGYFAPKQSSNAEDSAKAEIRDAVYSREEVHDLPVDLHTQFFKPDPADAKLTIVARVDLKRLHFRKQDGRNNDNLTVVAALFDRDGNFVNANEKLITMRLRDGTLERLNSGITVKTNFDVKPGAYVVRLVVRDAEGQMMAAENGAIDIP